MRIFISISIIYFKWILGNRNINFVFCTIVIVYSDATVTFKFEK